jgi:predicted naringenin-chalcone synthase
MSTKVKIIPFMFILIISIQICSGQNVDTKDTIAELVLKTL